MLSPQRQINLHHMQCKRGELGGQYQEEGLQTGQENEQNVHKTLQGGVSVGKGLTAMASVSYRDIEDRDRSIPGIS